MLVSSSFMQEIKGNFKTSILYHLFCQFATSLTAYVYDSLGKDRIVTKLTSTSFFTVYLAEIFCAKFASVSRKEGEVVAVWNGNLREIKMVL